MNSEMLMCPRCNITLNQRVVEAYERAQHARTQGNWRHESQLMKVYPKRREILLGILVCCYKFETKCLLCPRCGAVYDKEMD